MRFKHMICLAALSVPIATVHASDNVELNSFLTIGAATSSFEADPAYAGIDSIYLNSIDDRISFNNDSRYGINFRTQTSERLAGAAQLLGAGRNDNFTMEVEWAYVNYDFTDNTNMRVGKLNLQTFLLSDYIEVGYLYPWIRPPEEVYNFVPFRNFPGFELMHTARFGKSSLTSQLFIGSGVVELDPVPQVGNPLEFGGDFKGEDGIGVNFQLDTPYVTLRTGFITPVIKITDSAGRIVIDDGDRAEMFTLGISWDWSGFIGYGEYIDSTTEGDSKGFFPDQEGYYFTLGFQMGNFLPHVTVAGTDGEALCPTLCRQATIQDSFAFGIRYDINDSMAFKLEAKLIEPETAGSSFNTTPLAAGEEDFMITSFALDIIF